MYRVYAQAFFITTTLLVIFIFFNPEERFPFLSSVDMYLFLVAMLLFASFPVALVGRYLLKAKKLVLRVESKKMRQMIAVFGSRAVRLSSNVFGFLLVLLVCVFFLWFLIRGFGKIVSRPFFDALTKFFVRNTVQQTLNEMDFYKTRSLNQGDFEELKEGLESFGESSEQVKDYLRGKEFEAFLDRGAQKEIFKSIGTDTFGNRVALNFYLDDPQNLATGGFTDFSYVVFQRVYNDSECSDSCERRVGNFEISSKSSPKLNFELFEIPNRTSFGVLVVWWDSGELKRYVIFGPDGEIGDLGTWVVKCLEGCESAVYGQERPALVVSENEETGETEYIIKTGENFYPHSRRFKNFGYAVMVNELGGLDVERLELRE